MLDNSMRRLIWLILQLPPHDSHRVVGDVFRLVPKPTAENCMPIRLPSTSMRQTQELGLIPMVPKFAVLMLALYAE